MNLISIGGASRSGSTLLLLLLGKAEDSFVVGELRYVWTRGYEENMLCGCGVPFRSCDFWAAVLEEAYGRYDKVPIAELQALHSSVAEMRYFPRLMSPWRTRRFDDNLSDYVSHLEALCSAIQKVSGAQTIIDSSKLPSYCYLLSRIPGADVRFVHLVRDSRAVAYSFMRKKPKPDIHWTEAYMRRFSPLRSSFDWDVLNLGMDLMRTAKVPYDFLRYEDLVRDPRGVVQKLIPSMPGEALDSLVGRRVSIATNHSVSGNPLRFAQGTIEIRLDTEWQSSMRAWDRRLVTGLTWPLLKRYGYSSMGRGKQRHLVST